MRRQLAITLVLWVVALASLAQAQSLLHGPQGVSCDTAGRRFFVTDFLDGNVIQIDSNDVESYFLTGLGSCMYSTIDDDVLYVSSAIGIMGVSLSTGDTLLTVTIPGTGRLAGVAVDTSGFLYTVDSFARRIHRIRLADAACSTIVSAGLPFFPEALFFDGERNRLLLTSDLQQPIMNTLIVSVDLPSGALTTVATAPFGWCEGITRDRRGYWYITDWAYGRIFAFDSAFSNPPRIVDSGYEGPTGLCYDVLRDRLMIPEFKTNDVRLLEIRDADRDGSPDFYDDCTDVDGDGFGDPGFSGNSCLLDNCPTVTNPTQTDADSDGFGDACCCLGVRGNVNYLGIVDLADLSALVSFLTGGGYRLPCPNEANVNGNGVVDLSDLSSLVSYLTGGGYVLPNCS